MILLRILFALAPVFATPSSTTPNPDLHQVLENTLTDWRWAISGEGLIDTNIRQAETVNQLLVGDEMEGVRRMLRRGFATDGKSVAATVSAQRETFRAIYEQLDQRRRTLIPGEAHASEVDRLRSRILDTFELIDDETRIVELKAELKVLHREARVLRRVAPAQWQVVLKKIENIARGGNLRRQLVALLTELTALRFTVSELCAADLECVELALEGVSCANCVGRIERAVRAVSPDVVEAKVNLVSSEGRVAYRPGRLKTRDITDAIGAAGYGARIKDDGAPESISLPVAAKRERGQLIAAALLTAPIVAPMLLKPFGVNFMIPDLAQLALAVPTQFWFGRRFYRAAWSALKNRVGDMNVLVSLGTSAAFGLSAYAMFGHHVGAHPPLYFEASTMVTTLMLAGKYLESSAKQLSFDALKGLRALRPEVATVRRGVKEVEVPFKRIRLGDLVIVRSGEKIAVDGIVREGLAQVNESFLNGESRPVEKNVGDEVTGGSINEDGQLLVEATRVGGKSTLGQIIRAVEDAQSTKAPIQSLVDKVSQVFVPAIIGVSAATLLTWGLVSGDWAAGLIHAATVLVVSCPCALGLATPTAIAVGTGRAAQAGILIKDGAVLERAHRVNTVAFDKTGTLTENQPMLALVQARDHDEAKILSLSASLQSGSEHPMARALLTEVKARNIEWNSAENVRTLPGEGLEGTVDGKSILIGSERLLVERGFDTSDFTERVEARRAAGESVSFVAQDGATKEVLGIISYRDRIRPNARAAVEKLQKSGLKVVMLTGASDGSANRVANELGITDVRANLLPVEKARVIQSLRAAGEVVAMVGDGINDAPALASADVGIAMAAGTEVAMQNAGITLLRSDPMMVPAALDLSKQTYRKIKQNLFWAFGYNVVSIPMAAAGMVGPVLASGAMAVSSLGVVFNALWLKLWEP